MQFLQQHFELTLIFLVMISLIIGSFLNVVIYRLPIIMQSQWRKQCHEFLKINNESESSEGPLEHQAHHQGDPQDDYLEDPQFNLFLPASHCPNCKTKIRFWENIPLISYFLLRGKCAHCQSFISLQYPLVELLTSVLSIIILLKLGISIPAFSALILTYCLLVLVFIDLKHQLLPDDLTLTFLWFGLVLNLFGTFTDIHSAIIGAVGGYLSLWIVNKGFKLITGKEGMGYGDFKLFALFGAWLGWQLLPVIILASAAVGACVGLSLIIFKGHDRQVPIPFGPYLATAGWIAMLWGNDILRGYLLLFRS